jgi:hypothetical protein
MKVLCTHCGGSSYVQSQVDDSGLVEEVKCISCDRNGWQKIRIKTPQDQPMTALAAAFAAIERDQKAFKKKRRERG